MRIKQLAAAAISLILTLACEKDPILPETTPERPELRYGWVLVEGHIMIREEYYSGPVALICPSGSASGRAQGARYSILLRMERPASASPTEHCRVDVGDPLIVTEGVELPVASSLDAVVANAVSRSITVLPDLPPLARIDAPIAALTAASRQSCALSGDGRALCWGDNSGGQLGTGYHRSVPYPAAVVTVERFVQVQTTGYSASFDGQVSSGCGLRNDGAVFCWGDPMWSVLGATEPRQHLTPQRMPNLPNITRLFGGGWSMCGLTAGHELYCWGPFSTQPFHAGTDIMHRDGDRRFTCTVSTDRSWRCSSTDNLFGESGDTTGDQSFSKIAVGRDFACGLDADGYVWCWGRNHVGQLGRGNIDIECSNEYGWPAACPGQAKAIPQRVAGNIQFADLDAGQLHACGITTAGLAYCWGEGSDGQLGTGNTSRSATPVRVIGTATFRAIALGDLHSCAVSQDERVLCWGAGNSGQLGHGGSIDRAQPAPVATP